MKGAQSYGKSSQNPLASSLNSGYGNHPFTHIQTFLTFNAIGTKKSGKVAFNPQASAMSGTLGFGVSGHQATVPMNFRGQDKSKDPSLGFNPNQNVEDEYIGNLQQQIHFMELEMKILKEKVVEDEKKSGIGSLFDDEKSSQQHIQLLKTKYTKMRRDYDKKIEELNKHKLNVMGEQFVLDSQINIMLDQNQKLENQQREYDNATKKKVYELDRELKDTSKQRFELENEVKSLENELNKENEEHYNNTMHIIKDKKFDELVNLRWNLDVHLQEELIKQKDHEISDQKQSRELVKQQFEQNIELQKSLMEASDLKKQIEEAHIKLELLQIQVKELEDGTEFLNDKKEQLIEAKKQAEIRNEELRKELAAKEEIAAKRLQAKLNKDKNVEVKELIAQEETATQHNQELQAKLEEEKKKYDGLLDEKLELDEKLDKTIKSLEFYKEKIHVQTEQIQKLKAEIEVQQRKTDDLSAHVENERKINKIEEERYRKLGQMNAALNAKLKFIQTKYDFTSNVNVLNTDDFKTLVTSNDMVRNSLRIHDDLTDCIGELDCEGVR